MAVTVGIGGISCIRISRHVQRRLTRSKLYVFIPGLSCRRSSVVYTSVQTLRGRLQRRIYLGQCHGEGLTGVIQRGLPTRRFCALLGRVSGRVRRAFSGHIGGTLGGGGGGKLRLATSPDPDTIPARYLTLMRAHHQLIATFTKLIPSRPRFLTTTPPRKQLFRPSVRRGILRCTHGSNG